MTNINAKYLNNKYILNLSGFFDNVLVIDINSCSYNIIQEYNICPSNLLYRVNSKKVFNDLLIEEDDKVTIWDGMGYSTFGKDVNNQYINDLRESTKKEKVVYIGKLKNQNLYMWNSIESAIRQVIYNTILILLEANATIIFTRNDSIGFYLQNKRDESPTVSRSAATLVLDKQAYPGSKQIDHWSIINLINSKYKFISYKLEHYFSTFYHAPEKNSSYGLEDQESCGIKIYKSGIFKSTDDEILKEYLTNKNDSVTVRSVFKNRIISKQKIYLDLDEKIIWNSKVHYLYECFDTSKNDIYIFFDIDIIDTHSRIWTKEIITEEVYIFCREFYNELNNLNILNIATLSNKYVLDFAISYSIRKDKISIHLVSTNMMINNLYYFKNILSRMNFLSILGKNIDKQVYRHNGTFRVAGMYKESTILNVSSISSMPAHGVPSLSGSFIPDSKLIMLNYTDNKISHLITKPKCLDTILISPPFEYIDKYISNNKVNNTNPQTYEKFKPVLTYLIDKHFTYENCTLIRTY